ncbi:MAG TPA: response regulator transcription factor [Bacteroidales bacterium]|nr:response regulator transcription factor [Bacteroidales bacterium]HPM92024.1 response regulator transcription factor [Bacteroidales bacterium]
MRILVIEDEPKVAHFIKEGLEGQKHEVDMAYDGLTGESIALQNTYNLIILDIIIPYINGIELCRRIKSQKPRVPVMMLTALGTTDDKVTGFEAGADDYLVKPFEFRELIARVNALSKRPLEASGPPNCLKSADLELDLDKKVARRGGKTIELTAKEFSLLEYFMINKGRVVSRVDIAEKVWDINFDTGTNVVDVYVNILRKKIDKEYEPKLIHTRIGMGYIFGEE